MSGRVDAVRQEALALSASERASLEHDLILSLDDTAGYKLDSDQEAEIQRRVQMVRESRATGRPAAEVFTDLKRRTKRP